MKDDLIAIVLGEVENGRSFADEILKAVMLRGHKRGDVQIAMQIAIEKRYVTLGRHFRFELSDEGRKIVPYHPEGIGHA